MNLVGQHVGNYIVERELGAGGMGTVYMARHPVLGRQVAIKVLHDEHATNKDTVTRFFQEARAAAEIGEQHIIEVIDFGELEVAGAKVVYLMMELLDGVSLGKRIQQGRIPPDEVAYIALQVCAALAASHAKGIIHRDLKPENIYLCPRPGVPEFVKVLDFGIAKLTGEIKGSGNATRIGTVLGTPAYMSPEQCVGLGDIDGRADVYAFGIVMFEMLTGELPFSGGVGELIEAHLRRPPDPPSSRNPQVPVAWDAIVLRCLEKARGDRFSSMADLASALRDPTAHLAFYQQQLAARAQSAKHHQTAVMPPELRPDHVASAAAAGGLAAVAVAASPAPAAYGLDPTTGAPRPTPFPTPGPTGTPGPFTPVGAGAGSPTPAPYAPPTPAPYAPPTPAPYSPTPAPYSPTPAPYGPRAESTSGADLVPRGVSKKLVLGVVGATAVVALLVIGLARLFQGGDAPPPPTTEDRPAVVVPPIDAAAVAPVRAVVPVTIDAAVQPPTVVADAAVAPIRLTVTTQPRRARVTIQRGAETTTATAPHTIELSAAAPSPVTITVAAAGHVTVTQTVTPTADAEVLIVLPRAAVTPKNRPRRPRDTELIRPE